MTLVEAVQTYVERKRSEGFEYTKAEQNLMALRKHVGNVPLERVSARQVLTFLDGPKTSPVTWEKKYQLLRHFFEFWIWRGKIQILPMPMKRQSSPSAFVPYIYTHTEVHTLLKAVRRSQKEVWCAMSPLTLRTFLTFLYGTGALIGEVMRLSVDDVDIKRGTVKICSKSFYRSRTIPICSDLRNVLEKYLVSRRQQETTSRRFFLNKYGDEFTASSLGHTFLRLRRISGIVRHDGAHYQPRLHDLRHTFAVHRITGWIKHGADLNRMLPALAVYMGQAGLGSTERYLSLTPERFRPQLIKLSPRRGKKRWRDDPELMKFLSQLSQITAKIVA